MPNTKTTARPNPNAVLTFFEIAKKQLPPRIPVSTILFPLLTGDPTVRGIVLAENGSNFEAAASGRFGHLVQQNATAWKVQEAAITWESVMLAFVLGPLRDPTVRGRSEGRHKKNVRPVEADVFGGRGAGRPRPASVADPQGGTGWMVMDREYDQRAFFASIDTVLMGRKTFEVAGRRGFPGLRNYVFSRTLRPEDHPDVTIVAEDAASTVAALRAEEGKDIWLGGGGELFRSLVDTDLVDTVEVGINPILLGQGIPLVPPLPRSVRLELTKHEVYGSGLVILTYSVHPVAPSF